MTVYVLWLMQYELTADDTYTVLGVYTSAQACNDAKVRHLNQAAQNGNDTTTFAYRVDVEQLDNDHF